MPANKILFLANYFPPRPAVAGRRLGHLAVWAREHYAEVFVIRAERNFSGSDLANLHVIALPARDLRALIGGSGPADTLPHGSFRRRLSGPLLYLRQSYPFLYLTDDGGPAYRRHAYREAVRLIEQEGIGTVFSSFRPWSDHLIARRLKRRFPHLHWIADFRDIHADPVRRDVWFPALQRWWGRRMLATADEVWGVSEGQVQYLRAIYPAATVRRNRLVRLPPATSAPRSDRFTIVYTGSLYRRLHDVAPLVTAVNALIAEGIAVATDFKLVYRGKDAALWTDWTAGLHADVERDTGAYIAPASAQKLQSDAQLLLLLTWSGPDYYGVLTAKLYDYLSAGRPILALVQGPHDPELTMIVEDCHAGRVFATGEGPTAWLRTLYREWRAHGRRLPWQPDREALSAFLESERVG